MQWQPIETAPKDGTQILAYDGVTIECIFFDDHLRIWVTSWDSDESYERLGSPTHWMSLPAPPTT